MAQRTMLLFEDDLDGSDAVDTVSFTVEGVEYELDLSERNLAKFNKAIDPYVSAARRVGGRKRSVRSGTVASVATDPVDNKAVRAWAEANKIEVSSRGRIPAAVVDQYRAAGY